MIHVLYNGLVYPDLDDPIWTTSSPGRDTVFELNQKNRMTYAHVFGVVGGEAMTHDVFHTH